MAKVTQPERGRIRIDCDCGGFIHEIYRDGDKLLCETYKTSKAKSEPPAPLPRKTKVRDDLEMLLNGPGKREADETKEEES